MCSLLFSVSFPVLRDVYSWFSELKCAVFFCEILDVVSISPVPVSRLYPRQTCVIWNLIIAYSPLKIGANFVELVT